MEAGVGVDGHASIYRYRCEGSCAEVESTSHGRAEALTLGALEAGATDEPSPQGNGNTRQHSRAGTRASR
jgi:hypothetical protein